MARAVDPSDEIDPADDSVDLDTADDPEFADGFEIFDPEEEQPGLGDDAGIVVSEAEADLIEVDATRSALPLGVDDAQFDNDDAVSEPALDPDAEDEDEVEGVRGTEFVCLNCYLAKRRTQLADKKRSLCIDCV